MSSKEKSHKHSHNSKPEKDSKHDKSSKDKKDKKSKRDHEETDMGPVPQWATLPINKNDDPFRDDFEVEIKF